MTAMTFESINSSPRRAAARRTYRPATPLVLVSKAPVAIAAERAANDGAKPRYKGGLIILAAATIALHAAIIVGLNRPGEVAPLKAPKERLVLEIAPPKEIPPPPPPPVVQPKLQPVKAAPRAQPTPILPVVSAPTSDVATADTVQVATKEAPPPPPPVAAPVVEKITEARGYAGYLNNPDPIYPAIAQKRGLEGQVMLKVHVLASGKPDTVTVARSSGQSILDEAAVKAVLAWTFQPAKRGQTPIDGLVQVPITFKL